VTITAGRLRTMQSGRAARAWRWWTDLGALRTPTYTLLVMVVAVLNVIGLVMVLSASSVMSLDANGSAWSIFEREIVWTLLGVIAFLVASRVDYHHWQRLTIPLLVATFVGLAVVLVPGIGIYVDGSRRWLGWGQVRFQPSEVAKIGLLVFSADLLTRRARDVADRRKVLTPVLTVFAAVAFLVMLEPDLDTVLIYGLAVGAVLVVGGVPVRQLLAVGAAGMTFATVFALAVPFRRARMLTFLHPWADKTNTGYQISQSLIALGSGGLTGVGLGASRAKWRFLPAAHTDFIFAIIGEELGLLGCALVVGLFLGFAVLGTRAALRAPDRFGMLLAAGITAWIVGQAVINIGMVVGLLPVSGNTLPFVSFGGSSLLFGMIAAGILGNVARQGRR
jgi:cell division protein FtsW